MRTIVDISNDDIQRLETICRRADLTRAEAIRQAVARFIKQEDARPEQAFGLWAGRGDDGNAYQRRLRDEWDR